MKNVKIIALLTLGILLILIVVQNTAPVQARVLWFEAEVPVIVLLLVVAIGAFVAGILVSMLRSRKRGASKGRSPSRRSATKEHGGSPPQSE